MVSRASSLFFGVFAALFSILLSTFSVNAVYELVSLLFCRIFRKPIALLDHSNKLLTFTIDHVEIIIGKLAPFFFDLSLVLLPFALNLIPVHNFLLRRIVYSAHSRQTWSTEDDIAGLARLLASRRSLSQYIRNTA